MIKAPRNRTTKIDEGFYAPVPVSPSTLDPSSAAARLLAAFLAGRKEETIKAYRADLEDFQAFVGASTLDQAAGLLMARGLGEANALALAYRTHLVERELAAITINRRLTALRSMIKLARTLGLIPRTLEIQGLKTEGYRDTRGPGRNGFRALLEVLNGRSDAKTVRDRAILRCLFDLGLRRKEVITLDLEDFDRQAGTLAVLGKGRTAKNTLTLPPQTRQSLETWIDARGLEPGPLFLTMNRANQGDGLRLTAAGLYGMVRELGRKAGLKVWPHGIRHSAITEALDATSGNIRAVQRFSRHKDVRVVERYDDNRQDLAGEVARKVAASVPDETLLA
jgi:integrase/recombinase XerC